MTYLQAEDLSADTIEQVNKLSLKPGQEQFVCPVSYASTVHINNHDSLWQQVIKNENTVVGFIQGIFDPLSTEEFFRAAVWKIIVDASSQGEGIGRFAIRCFMNEAHKRDISQVSVLWERGENSPEEFFLSMGFNPVGETRFGEVIAVLDVNAQSSNENKDL